MAAFIPQFAHDTLLKLAEAGYLPTINPATDLPAGYVVVGQITAGHQVAAQLVANAPAQHQQLLTSWSPFFPGRLDFGSRRDLGFAITRAAITK